MLSGIYMFLNKVNHRYVNVSDGIIKNGTGEIPHCVEY